MAEARVDELIQRYLDSTIAPSEFAELQRLVVSDAAAADAFVKASRMDAVLQEHFAESQRETESAAIARQAVEAYGHGDDYVAVPPPRRRFAFAPIGIAATVLFAAGVGVWFALQENIREPTPGSVARESHRLISGRALIDGLEGQPIRDGSRIDVLNEKATILLGDGSQAVLEPESTAIVRGQVGELRQVVALLAGGGRFQVEKGQGRFQVETPIGPVIVLGTDFELHLQNHDWMGEDEMRVQRIMILSVVVLTGSVQVDVGGEQVTLAAGANRAFADEPRREEGKPEATGRFVGYNANNGTLVIAGKEGRGEITFAVAKDARVTIDGVAGKLVDLTDKHIVQLMLNADRSTVLEVRSVSKAADRPRERGDRRVIASVNVEKRTVTFKSERENATFAVSKDARIIVGGREARLSEVKPGSAATVQFADDQKTVVMIRLGERDGEGEKPGPRDGERGDFRGQLEKYDDKAGTIVVVQRGDGGAERRATLLVAKDVKIVAEGAKDLKLADIAINTPISVNVNEDRTTAVSIRIEMRPVRRIVFDVDGEKYTVTFRVERERITLPVLKDARITIDNKRAQLTDLKQGAVCFATMSPDGKTVVAINWRTPQGARDGDRPAPKEGDRKDGERKKDAPRDGEGKKDAPRDGERKRDGE